MPATPSYLDLPQKGVIGHPRYSPNPKHRQCWFPYSAPKINYLPLYIPLWLINKILEKLFMSFIIVELFYLTLQEVGECGTYSDNFGLSHIKFNVPSVSHSLLDYLVLIKY